MYMKRQSKSFLQIDIIKLHFMWHFWGKYDVG